MFKSLQKSKYPTGMHYFLLEHTFIIYTLGNKVRIRKMKATGSADRDFLVIYSGHGYMTYDNK